MRRKGRRPFKAKPAPPTCYSAGYDPDALRKEAKMGAPHPENRWVNICPSCLEPLYPKFWRKQEGEDDELRSSICARCLNRAIKIRQADPTWETTLNAINEAERQARLEWLKNRPCNRCNKRKAMKGTVWCALCAIAHNERNLGHGDEPDDQILSRIELFKTKI